MKRLPRSLDDLARLRAARLMRESTERQTDRFGRDAQRDQQDRAMARYDLVDTGHAWQVAHSGRTIATTSQFGEMVAAAGRDFEVVLVGYVSRFARDLRMAVNARRGAGSRRSAQRETSVAAARLAARSTSSAGVSTAYVARASVQRAV